MDSSKFTGRDALPPSIPKAVKGPVSNIVLDADTLYWYPWLQNIKTTDTYVHLAASWPTQTRSDWPECPPSGYRNYIVSGDSLMIGWANVLARNLDGNIIQLFQSIIPADFPSYGCHYHVYNTAHLRIGRLAQHLDIKSQSEIPKNIRFKASALTHRITQSKIIVFAALQDLLSDQDLVVSLRNHVIDQKNVHGWGSTPNAVCNHYIERFRSCWQGTEIELPWDDGCSWSCNNPAYHEAALNFTQESYHYSLDGAPGHGYMRPGPFLTEKTWKCLLSETAFIPVGQYHSYHWLKRLGLEFDYGELDLSFDEQPGDLDRLEKIVSLIDSLNNFTADEIFEMTRSSTLHNRQWISSGDFYDLCEKDNQEFYDFLDSLT